MKALLTSPCYLELPVLNYGAQLGLTHVAAALALISWLSVLSFKCVDAKFPQVGVCDEGLCYRLRILTLWTVQKVFICSNNLQKWV